MRKVMLTTMLCVVIVMMCIGAMAADRVIMLGVSWSRTPSGYHRGEWGYGPGVAQVFSINNSTGNDGYGRHCHGAKDMSFDGHMGDENGAGGAAQYTGETMYQIGTTLWKNGTWGEGRMSICYNLDNVNDGANGMGWVRHFDTDYFGPSASIVTTDGFGFDLDGDGPDIDDFNISTGPTKNMFRCTPSLYSYTGGWGYWTPTHFGQTNTTDVPGGVPLAATIDRILWGLGLTHTGYSGPVSGITDEKIFQIVHIQPGMASINVASTDKSWGSHSDGSDYTERVVYEETVGDMKNSAPDEFAFKSDPMYAKGGLCRAPYNYPASRQAVVGTWLIDDSNPLNDQNLYTGAGDDSPVINSFIADMRDGRSYVWFTLRMKSFYSQGFPQNDYHYIAFHPYRGNRVSHSFRWMWVILPLRMTG